MAEAKPPSSLFGNLFKGGANKTETVVDAPITSAARVDPQAERFDYTTTVGHDQYSPVKIQQEQKYLSSSSSSCCPLSKWTNADLRNVVFASVLPLGISAFAMTKIGRNEQARKFIEENASFGKIYRHPNVYVILSVATVAPLGYASYLVWKCGGGFESTQTKVALGLYGFTLFNILGTVPALESGNLKWVASSSLLITAGAAATAYAFGKIERTAGYLVIPFALWSACKALPWLYRICPCSSSSSSDSKPSTSKLIEPKTESPKATTTAIKMPSPVAFGEE